MSDLRRSLACTNIIESMNGTIRQVCRNVKRWQDASMHLRRTSTAMLEAAKGFRRLKAQEQLPALRATLPAHQRQHALNPTLDRQAAGRCECLGCDASDMAFFGHHARTWEDSDVGHRSHEVQSLKIGGRHA